MAKALWKHCHQCGEKVRELTECCGSCGAVLCCPQCHAPIYPSFRYCGSCGTAISQSVNQKGSEETTWQGKRLSEWMDDLVGHDGRARIKACKAILAVGDKAEPAIAALVGRLEADEREHRLLPAEGLLQLGRETDRAAAIIVEALRSDPSKDVRLTALGSIMKNGPKAEAAVPGLIEALTDNTQSVDLRDVPCLAAEALGWIGARASSAIPALKNAATSSDSDLREAAQKALKRLKQG